jgi:ribosomal protein S18 acetylase RimI-like enzyme
MDSAMTGARVRTARADDAGDSAFLRSMAPRLEAEMPAWIPKGALATAVERSVLGALRAQREGEAILVAEDAHGLRLGFVYVVTSRENLAREPRCYVSELAVAAEAEGRGVGRALLAAAEQWARERGLQAMSLEVFCTNERARAIYERLGYEPSALQLRKRLGASGGGTRYAPSGDPGLSE